MQTIFKQCPFKENGKLSKLFCLILRGLNLPVGSDTPQNNVLRGLVLRLTKSCGVSDPAEQSFAVYHTPRCNFKYEYMREFDAEFNNILESEFWEYMGSIRGKNQRLKISYYCPFKVWKMYAYRQSYDSTRSRLLGWSLQGECLHQMLVIFYRLYFRSCHGVSVSEGCLPIFFLL